MQLKPIKLTNSSPYAQPAGRFATVVINKNGTATGEYTSYDWYNERKNRSKALHYYHCREIFATNWGNYKAIAFAHMKDEGENVARFINDIEDKLNLSPRAKSKCYKASETELCINVSNFWLGCQMRRQVLTVLLRIGRQYNETKSINETIKHHGKYRALYYTLTHFIDGNVNFNQGIVKQVNETIKNGQNVTNGLCAQFSNGARTTENFAKKSKWINEHLTKYGRKRTG